jgi:hypothetical protein
MSQKAVTERHFPPWTVEDIGVAFKVCDSAVEPNGGCPTKWNN